MNETAKRLGFSTMFFAGLIVSAINPRDYFTWILEVFPAVLAFVFLAATYGRFRLTGVTYLAMLALCYILFVGGHYTYAEVPLFNWIRDAFGQQRNNFDKVGHFAQGFVPALFFRETFVRFKVVPDRRWLPILVVCACMTVSVLYEFLEWFVSEATGEAAEAFLGTQGDVWDTQWDLLFCMLGATTAVVGMSGIQDRQIAELNDTAHRQDF